MHVMRIIEDVMSSRFHNSPKHRFLEKYLVITLRIFTKFRPFNFFENLTYCIVYAF